jgi:hypothetical protein
MKAVVYSPESSKASELGVRIEERAHYLPVLESALRFNVQKANDAHASEDYELADYYTGRAVAIDEFLTSYDASIRVEGRYFDITLEEVEYVRKDQITMLKEVEAKKDASLSSDERNAAWQRLNALNKLNEGLEAFSHIKEVYDHGLLESEPTREFYKSEGFVAYPVGSFAVGSITNADLLDFSRCV